MTLIFLLDFFNRKENKWT